MNNKNIISNKFDLFWTTTFSYTAEKKIIAQTHGMPKKK